VEHAGERDQAVRAKEKEKKRQRAREGVAGGWRSIREQVWAPYF